MGICVTGSSLLDKLGAGWILFRQVDGSCMQVDGLLDNVGAGCILFAHVAGSCMQVRQKQHASACMQCTLVPMRSIQHCSGAVRPMHTSQRV
jgi:hypothetical protein